MGAAFFYHLTRRPLEATLPMLLTKAQQVGWRVAVRGRDDARMEWLDEKLWLVPEDGFLAHGLAGRAHEAEQPVLLTTQRAMPNGAVCLMAVDGAEVAPEEVQALERVCILFDGNDTAALDAARGQWKALTGAGCKAQYWSEDSGRWEMRAEA
ncbi:MAG: DNA polymerase III subunit chi [Pseudomonadota bacterium]|uniref:DNA polymerase III subunit chi n=1 Tax=Roseovarius TaxID=74030 RepID=UPI0022A66959|nr:DNA polymerase III subunit chi [Roseovarius sp. EGI FJ00037]MCZ0811067.1 DNA polymerase III subunit chi [Roseovarius sp. EGI FJ00037]